MKTLTVLAALCSATLAQGLEIPRFETTRVELGGAWEFRPAEGRETPDEAMAASGWRRIRVPGSWEAQGVTEGTGWRPYNGYAWYRLRLTVPEEWSGYPLVLELGTIDDADRTFFNGRLVGSSSQVIDVRSYVVPAEAVQYGGENLLAVEVLDTGGDGGIMSAPFIRPRMPWEDACITVTQERGGGLYEPGETASFTVEVTNPLSEEVPLTLLASATPYRGDPLPIHEHAVSAPPGDTTYTFSWRPPAPGHFDIVVEARTGEVPFAAGRSALAVLEPLPPGVPKYDSVFALNSGGVFHEFVHGGDPRREFPLLLRASLLAGAGWGRTDLWWSLIEPERGRYEWREADVAVELFEKAGVRLLGILCYGSAWSGGAAPSTEDERRAFGDYVYALVARYKGRVSAWEVWNEPNLAMFWSPDPDPHAYARLLRTAYARAKEADPSVTVVGCAVSHVDLDFIRTVIAEGGLDWMDAISVHLYEPEPADLPGQQFARIYELRRLLEEAGRPLPIWVTEIGWPTVAGFSESDQVAHVARLYATCCTRPLADWVEKVFYFSIHDWAPRGTGGDGHFGLTYLDRTPKPALLAYRTAAAMLSRARFERRLDTGDGRTALLFRRQGKDLVVAWSEGEARLDLRWDGEARAYDAIGRPLRIRQSPATVLLPLTGEPVYLLGERRNPQRLLPRRERWQR